MTRCYAGMCQGGGVKNHLSQSQWTIIDGCHDSPCGVPKAGTERRESRGHIKLGNTSSIVPADGRNRYPSPLWDFRVYLVTLKKRGKAKVKFTAIHWHGKI